MPTAAPNEPTTALRVATPDPDARYCDFVAAASAAGYDFETAADLSPELLDTRELLRQLRAAKSPSESSISPHRIGRFVLRQPLGHGGAATVYEALDPNLGRTVAVKVLHANHAHRTTWRERFRAEGPALAKLSHPNVVQVHESGEADGIAYLVMEHLPGPTLHQHAAHGPLPSRDAAALVAAVAEGVAHAHAAGILHRDLKPANVLLDVDGRPKVADFGLAAAVEAGGTGHTATGEVVGTPNYLAPEAIDGTVGVAADVYGLGAILYELLTGRPPFAGSTPLNTLLQVRTTEPAAPRAVNPEVPADLQTICLKCLAKSPLRRYASATDVADDLRAWLAGRPIAARPPGLGETCVRWVRQRPVRSVAVIIMACTLVAGLVAWAEHTRRLTASLMAERAAVTLAESRRDQLADVVDILRNVFHDIDPQRLQADGIPLERALADGLVAAADKLKDDGLGDPVTVCFVRDDLGVTLLELGFPDKAVPLFEACRRTLEHHPDFGPDHERTVSVVAHLADALKQNGRLDLALPLCREVYARHLRRHGPDHEDTVWSQNELHMALEDAGLAEEAAGLVKELYDRSVNALGADHHLTLQNEAHWIETLDIEPADKVARFEQIVERCRRSCGANHPHTLNLRLALASALVNADRTADGVALYKAVIRDTGAARGADHPDTIEAIHQLAIVHEELRQKVKAGAAHADAMARLMRRGFRQFTAEAIVTSAAQHAQKTGRLADAEEWLRKWAQAVAQQNPNSNAHANALEMLGANLMAQKKWSDAEPVLLAARHAWTTRPGEEKRWVSVDKLLAQVQSARKTLPDK